MLPAGSAFSRALEGPGTDAFGAADLAPCNGALDLRRARFRLHEVAEPEMDDEREDDSHEQENHLLGLEENRAQGRGRRRWFDAPQLGLRAGGIRLEPNRIRFHGSRERTELWAGGQDLKTSRYVRAAQYDAGQYDMASVLQKSPFGAGKPGSWSMAGVAARVRESLPRLRDELPVVGGGVERQLQHAEGCVLANLAVRLG